VFLLRPVTCDTGERGSRVFGRLSPTILRRIGCRVWSPLPICCSRAF